MLLAENMQPAQMLRPDQLAKCCTFACNAPVRNLREQSEQDRTILHWNQSANTW